jgi:rhodanese-related sulfurtransferase
MYKALKQLLGIGPGVNYAELIRSGAIVLDVRTPAEYDQAHINGAMNIPVEKLRDNLHRLAEKHKVIIACCTDGSKSWYAKNFLDANGYRFVYDAGNWTKLQRKLQHV